MLSTDGSLPPGSLSSASEEPFKVETGLVLFEAVVLTSEDAESELKEV